MNIVNLTAALTMIAMFAATPVLAQSSQLAQPQSPTFQNPGGVAGGFAGSNDKDTATKQKTQNLTPSSGQDSWENGKPK